MRTVTTQETSTLQSAAGRASHVRVWIKDAGGTFRDLSAIESRDFLDGVEIDEQIDQPVAKASVSVRREIDRFALSPLRADSKLNGSAYGGAALVKAGREFYVEACCVPVGTDPQASDWREMFRGDVDRVEFAGEVLTFEGRDLGGRLQDAWIETERTYGSAGGVAVETVMQSVLNDNGLSAVSLYTPTSPGWLLKPYVQKTQSVLDALRDLALQIGWDVRYKWRSSAGAFVLTFAAPNRSASSAAWTFGPVDYRDVTQLAISREDVRNKVEVVYSDLGTLDAAGRATRQKLVLQDATSQTSYGVRYMQIAEGASSNINSATEANKLAQAALDDLKDPSAEKGVELDLFWPVELGDLYSFTANGTHYSATQTLAVAGFKHTFDGGDARTEMTLRGKPAFGVSQWLELETRPGQAPPISYAGPDAPPLASIVVTPTVKGFAAKWTRAATGPVATEFEVHASTSTPFTPSSATLKGVTAAERFDVADLAAATTYYVKIVPRAGDNRGTESAQISVTTAKLNGADVTNGAQIKVDSYDLEKAAYRALNAIASGSPSDAAAGPFIFRGNNDSSVNGGAPNIACVNVSASDQVAASARSYGLWLVTVTPTALSDNLDSLRCLDVEFWVGNTSSAIQRGRHLVPINDRVYFDLANFSNAENQAAVSFQWEFPALFYAAGNLTPTVYLKVALTNCWGDSAYHWFVPSGTIGTAFTRQVAAPFSGGLSGGGGGGGGTGGDATCPAPDEPILLADGREVPAEFVQVGDRLLTYHEHTALPGEFPVTHVSRHENQWRFKVTLEDGRTLVASRRHRVYVEGLTWVELHKLQPGDRIYGSQPGVVQSVEDVGRGPVIKMTVSDAHTFVHNGLLGHNVKPR